MLPLTARNRTGWRPGSSFKTDGVSASAGNWLTTAPTLLWTSMAAVSTLAESRKVIVIWERPSLDDDWSTSTFAMPAIASDNGWVTSRSTSSGDAPEYVVATVTTGTLMLGKSSAFNLVKETRPRMTIARITIRMNTGRAMATQVRPISASTLLLGGVTWAVSARTSGMEGTRWAVYPHGQRDTTIASVLTNYSSISKYRRALVAPG